MPPRLQTSPLLRNAFDKIKSSETVAMTLINARGEGGTPVCNEHSHHLAILI
jgi:hypothetical protein